MQSIEINEAEAELAKLNHLKLLNKLWIYVSRIFKYWATLLIFFSFVLVSTGQGTYLIKAESRIYIWVDAEILLDTNIFCGSPDGYWWRGVL